MLNEHLKDELCKTIDKALQGYHNPGLKDIHQKLFEIKAEALIDTGISDANIIKAMRQVVPEDQFIDIERNGPRVTSIKLRPGRMSIREAFEKLPLNEFLTYKTEYVTKEEREFIKEKLMNFMPLLKQDHNHYLRNVKENPEYAAHCVELVDLIFAQKLFPILAKEKIKLFGKKNES